MRFDLTLQWRMFRGMTAARSKMGAQPCVYVQTDRARRPVRVGNAPHGLSGQFRGTLAEAFDAALHKSGNLIFVAPAKGPSCRAIERELLWRLRGLPLYNQQVPLRAPRPGTRLRHKGSPPKFPLRVARLSG